MPNSFSSAPFSGTPAGPAGSDGARKTDVVEIGLLLPTAWADGLVEMSRRQGRSVAQILRGLIDRALADDRASRP